MTVSPVANFPDHSVIDGEIYDAKKMEAFSKLPGKKELISMLMSAMLGNTSKLARTLQAVVDKKTAENQLQALLGAITNALASGEDVTVTDNFKLSVEQRAARTGRNPKTGETIAIPAKRVIKFSAYKHFRDAVA